jgi:hypothetical protein
LFGQHRADQADDRDPVGEDPDDVGAPADFLVEPLLRVVGPDLPPDLAREGGEGQQVAAGVVEVLGGGRELLLDRLDRPAGCKGSLATERSSACALRLVGAASRRVLA